MNIFDPELLSDEYNTYRTQALVPGTVVNQQQAGLFISKLNLAKCEWTGDAPLSEVQFEKGPDVGLLLSKTRFVVIAYSNIYGCYKQAATLEKYGIDPSQAGKFLGLQDYGSVNKDVEDSVREYILVFLDKANNPLHKIPIRFKFKNVALWSIRAALDRFYPEAEATFAQLTNTRVSNKDDKWRSLVVVNCEFGGDKVGKDGSKSWCCRVRAIESPNSENFPRLFLGTTENKEKKELVWRLYDLYCMSTTSPVQLQPQLVEAKVVPALPSSDPYAEAEVEEDYVPY